MLKLMLYIFTILFSKLLFAYKITGVVSLSPSDTTFSFHGRKLTVTDTSGNFGDVQISSVGNFIFPNQVNDNTRHMYSLSLQVSDNSLSCSIPLTTASNGYVFMQDVKIEIVCQDKYSITISTNGLNQNETMIATLLQFNNSITLTNSLSTQSFPKLLSLNNPYTINLDYNYTGIDYKKCQNNVPLTGVITSNLNLSINCITSVFKQINSQPIPVRSSTSSWTDKNGNAYIFGGFRVDWNGNIVYYNDLWRYDIKTTQWTLINITGDLPSPRKLGLTWVDSNGNGYNYVRPADQKAEFPVLLGQIEMVMYIYLVAVRVILLMISGYILHQVKLEH